MFPFWYSTPLTEPLDLSYPRRSDSVETHKSPSPPISSHSSEEGSNNHESSRTSTNEYKPTTHTINHFGVRIANMSTYPGFLPLYTGMHFDQQTQNQFFAHTVARQMLQIATPKRNSETPESESEASTSNQEVKANSISSPNSFKNYPKYPAELPAYFNAKDNENYIKFRDAQMAQIYASRGGQPTVTNPRMRRTVSSNKVSEQESSEGDADKSSNPKKDQAYYERRMKNNASAKKSRDKKRIHEDELTIRNKFLHNENAMLRAECNALREQLSRRQNLFNFKPCSKVE